ncbi:MAG: L-threonylcarbamoyladenylate synthase [Firmicutes bacterium]|nr:L-threonylcarbamoyladenylate synthase [Bacillota bacterium]
MDTKILQPTQSNLELVAAYVQQGGVVAFATETVFGLGCSVFDLNAIEQIYALKGRPHDNPLIVHIEGVESLGVVAKNVSPLAKKLLKAFAPGPISLVLERADKIPSSVSAGLATVCVRIPKTQSARDLIKTAGVPICAPSANLSTRVSPTSAEHVLEDFDTKIAYILDFGESEQEVAVERVGIESTIVDCTKKQATILREGVVTKQEIEKVLGQKVLLAKSGSKVVAPGTKYLHYAPKVPLVYFEHKKYEKKMVETVLLEYERAKSQGHNPVILCTTETKKRYGDCHLCCLGGEPKAIARNLYSALRRLEKTHTLILAEGYEPVGVFAAIDNKLKKASGEQPSKNQQREGKQSNRKTRQPETSQDAWMDTQPKQGDTTLGVPTEALEYKDFFVLGDNVTTTAQPTRPTPKEKEPIFVEDVAYTPQQGPEWHKGALDFSILFVCSGNTCRSPMMEFIFKDFVKDKPQKIVVASSGLFADENQTMTKSAERALQELGVAYQHKQAKFLEREVLDKYDMVVTMTAMHKVGLPNYPRIVSMDEIVGYEIPDPFGGDASVYQSVAQKLQQACKQVYERLLRQKCF